MECHSSLILSDWIISGLLIHIGKFPHLVQQRLEGEWILGPAYDFFDEVYKCFPDIHLVAEDLGDLRPQVLKLRVLLSFERNACDSI